MTNLQHELRSEYARLVTRRWFFRQCGVGLGSIALASLLGTNQGVGAPRPKSAGNTNPLAPRPPHFTPKAKRVIYLFMAGAPSQLDLFDYKPTLAKYDGKPVPQEVVMGQKYAFIKPDAALYATEFKFARHGNLRGPPAPGGGGGRYRHRKVDDHGCLQSCPGPVAHANRLYAVWPSLLWIVGALWPGQRSAEPAWV